MRKISIILFLFSSLSAHAVMIGFKQFDVNFTNSAKLPTNVVWAPADRLSISTNGLGWTGETNAYRDFSIQSSPVPVGTAWRPTRGVQVTLKIDPKPVYYSAFFVRYSPDKKHWSTWQGLDELHGVLRVPGIASGDYDQFISQYARMDVPWRSDEEAAVKWILQQQPDFFEKNLPFIGYVQFRMEGSIPGNQTIKSINMDLSWMVSGLHSPPKNPENDKTSNGPWRFEAK